MRKINKVLSLLIILLVISLVTGLTLKKLGYSFTVKIVKTTPPRFLQMDNLKTEEGLFVSNREWLRMVESLPKGVLSKIIFTTTVKAKVIEISDEKGRQKGYKDYYTEEKGYYVYYGRIKLLSSDNLKRDFYFSRRRMDIMNVYEVRPEGNLERNFTDIKPGDQIEMDETVDLTVSNINDRNVLALIIRIYK